MTTLRDFAVWLAHSPITAAVTARSWFVPEIQIVHILAIAAIVIAVVQINLRALGLIETDRTLQGLTKAWLPVIFTALAILAFTGFLLIASEPGRALFRTVFWVKLGLIVAATAVTASQSHAVWTPVADRGRAGSVLPRLISVASLLLWGAVIFAGRWIAYAEGWPGAFS